MRGVALNDFLRDVCIDDPKVKERINEYINRKWGYITNDYFAISTTKEDIAFINETLDMVTEYLQNKVYSSK